MLDPCSSEMISSIANSFGWVHGPLPNIGIHHSKCKINGKGHIFYYKVSCSNSVASLLSKVSQPSFCDSSSSFRNVGHGRWTESDKSNWDGSNTTQWTGTGVNIKWFAGFCSLTLCFWKLIWDRMSMRASTSSCKVYATSAPWIFPIIKKSPKQWHTFTKQKFMEILLFTSLQKTFLQHLKKNNHQSLQLCHFFSLQKPSQCRGKKISQNSPCLKGNCIPQQFARRVEFPGIIFHQLHLWSCRCQVT